LIVPFPVDGVTDLTARALARHLERRWSVPVKVRNVAGSGGTTGTLELLGAAPDGRTMMLSATGQATQNPAIDSTLPYRWHDPLPVVRVSASALAIVVRGDSRWTTLRELLAQVRTAPASHRIGTSGTGGASILALARLFESGGIALADLGRVTFHGGAAILQAVIDGRTDLAAQYVGEMGDLIGARLPGQTCPRRSSAACTASTCSAGPVSSARPGSMPASSIGGSPPSATSRRTRHSSARSKRWVPPSPGSTPPVSMKR
jgi:tripartite-type tricarboxylate transporter receptor subunit TctC